MKDLRIALAKAIGVEPNELSNDAYNRLITIRRGMFWSKNLDDKIKDLAKEIEKEFYTVGTLHLK